jgi:hypothetical protein
MHGTRLGLGDGLGLATAPACNDTGGSTESATSVQAYSLTGIAEDRAIARRDQPDLVYVARGVCESATTPDTLSTCLRSGS